MKIRNVIFKLDEMNEWIFKVSWNDCVSKDRLKRAISQFLEVGFEKFFDSHI